MHCLEPGVWQIADSALRAVRVGRHWHLRLAPDAATLVQRDAFLAAAGGDLTHSRFATRRRLGEFVAALGACVALPGHFELGNVQLRRRRAGLYVTADGCFEVRRHEHAWVIVACCDDRPVSEHRTLHHVRRALTDFYPF